MACLNSALYAKQVCSDVPVPYLIAKPFEGFLLQFLTNRSILEVGKHLMQENEYATSEAMIGFGPLRKIGFE